MLAEAVTIRDRSGTIVYANRAALESMKLGSGAELRGQTGREIMSGYDVEDEHGRPLTVDDLPGVRMISGEQPEPLLIRALDHGSGEVRWQLLKTTALNDRRGRFLGAMTVIEDVTAVKTAELRMRVLAESGRILASSLDREQTLRNIAEVAVPSLADYCGVDLLDDERRLERVAAVHTDPAKGELAAALRGIARYRPAPGSPGAEVLESGASLLYPEVGEEQLRQTARGEEHLRLIRELGIRSAMLVPMRVPGRTVGLLTLITDAGGRKLTTADLELAEQLGRRAGVAVENSRLHSKLQEIAETLQRSLRPNDPPAIPGWEAAALYRPAQSELRVDVGGDFYDFFERDGTWFAIIGDVTGSGITAASMTALMRHGARFASRTEPDPAAILRRLDEALKQQAEQPLCTAICLSLHDDHVLISSAGHPPALLARAGQAVVQAPDPGPLLGAFEGATWPQERIPVEPGQVLVMYTDGVIETAGRSERFGTGRLRQLVAEHAGGGPELVLARLAEELDAFSDGLPRDDVAAVALRRA